MKRMFVHVSFYVLWQIHELTTAILAQSQRPNKLIIWKDDNFLERAEDERK